MTDNLNTALAEILNKAASAADTATDFLKEQIPDVVQQAMHWWAAQHAVALTIGGGLLATIFLLRRKFLKECDADEVSWWGSLGLAAITSVIPCAVVICNLLSLLELWLAPKVYLLEVAAKLIGK